MVLIPQLLDATALEACRKAFDHYLTNEDLADVIAIKGNLRGVPNSMVRLAEAACPILARTCLALWGGGAGGGTARQPNRPAAAAAGAWRRWPA